jgi:hypothetical protein
MSLNHRLLSDAAQHLDTVAERLYESTLLAFDKRRVPKQMETRAKLMRISRELREIADRADLAQL